jgi:lipoprotein-anchoring transpeptidase ErfK/SrfK
VVEEFQAMNFVKFINLIQNQNTRNRVALALFTSLFWSAPALMIAKSTVVLAQDSQTGEAASEDSAKASPPDNSEWVAAWVTDLKQSSKHWIQVDLSDQQLTAWEGDTPVSSTPVSTGRASDATPTGVYEIEDKYRIARMKGDHYDILDVPYTMYFSGSYAIHGAYWHDNFGAPVSSGCINVPVDQASWLFQWASVGTKVVVQK